MPFLAILSTFRVVGGCTVVQSTNDPYKQSPEREQSLPTLDHPPEERPPFTSFRKKVTALWYTLYRASRQGRALNLSS